MSRDALVGRDREIAYLERRLDEALRGEGAVVLIEGEAGAGKTQLAGTLARRARRREVSVAWGACLEGEGAAPYRPWTQILRALGHPDVLDAGSREQLFDEVTDVLRGAAAGAGLLMVVDDLHWADEPSIRLLSSVTGRLADDRLMLVGLYRDRDAFPYADLTEVLRTILRERVSSQITLGGLTLGEIGELAALTARTPLDEATLHALHERSAGNPLFVLELLNLIEATGRAEGELPRGIREVIERRLARLSPATGRLLRQAAVLGREFPLGLLGAITGEPPDRLLDLLAEAIEDRLVSVPDGYSPRFDHILTQEVLYAGLAAQERPRAHARAARALEESGGPIESLAHHLRQAAPAGTAAPALAATRRAARKAYGELAYEHAAYQYRQALALLPLLPDGPDARAELLLELGRCQFRAGAVEDAWRSCRQAADLGRAAGDAIVVADAATVLRGVAYSPVTAQVHALCREALALLDGADPVREARLLAQLAVTADQWAGGPEPGLVARALAAAEATGDPEARFHALRARHAELIGCEHVHERLAVGERAVRLGRETGIEECVAWGHSWRMDALWELGRRVELDTELLAFTNLVEHMREPLWRWRLTMIRASLALFEGRFGEARSLAGQALVIGRRGGYDDADFMHLIITSELALQTGEGLDELEYAVRAFTDQGPYFARGWLAQVLVARDRLEEARTIWTAVAPHVGELPANILEWIVAMTGHAELCSALGDRATAPAVHAALLPFADRQVMSAAHTPCGGPVALYLGRLALLLEDWPAAETRLHAALESGQAMNSPPYTAIAHLELARLGYARRAPGDPRTAAIHREKAHDLARRLGMAPLAARAAALGGTGHGPLSPREEQVAALVAEGFSNRQIATRLHLSERTVENHVTHILTKLGFESRARIAAWHTSRTP